MDIKQLRYFCTVVEEGTVTRAASLLHMTQPPLTAQLQALEKDLGCTLFYREGRRLQLSEAGRYFYEKAKAILQMCDSTQKEMENIKNGTNGTLRLGVVSSVQGALFVNWMSYFHSMYPDVTYDLYNENTYQLLEHLDNGLLDLAIVRTPFPTSNYDIQYVQEEPLLAIGLPAYFSGLQEHTISLRSLSQKPLLLYRRWQKILLAQFESIGCTPTITCTNDNAQMTLALVQSGMGVGIVPASALSDLGDCTVQSRMITEPSIYSSIALVRKKKKQTTEAASLFWNMFST